MGQSMDVWVIRYKGVVNFSGNNDMMIFKTKEDAEKEIKKYFRGVIPDGWDAASAVLAL